MSIFENGKNLPVRSQLQQKVEGLIRDIQFQENKQNIYTMDFSKQFEFTNSGGDGNYSNHVSSLAWYISNTLDSHDYKILNFNS